MSCTTSGGFFRSKIVADRALTKQLQSERAPSAGALFLHAREGREFEPVRI